MKTTSVVSIPLLLSALLLAGCTNPLDAPDFPEALVAPTLASHSAGAGPPLVGGGGGMITSLEITPIRVAGGNSIQERTLTGELDGTLQGTFVEHARGVVHRTGLVTFTATFDFDGTVVGCGSGTLRASLSGQGEAGLPVTEANFRVIKQAASTLKVSGTGTVRQEGPVVSYEVRYVCR